jgi:hypothetical protein
MGTVEILVALGQTLIIGAACHSGLGLVANAIDRVAEVQARALRGAQGKLDELHSAMAQSERSRPRTAGMTPDEIMAVRQREASGGARSHD